MLSCQEKKHIVSVSHLMLYYNFDKCEPIYKIFHRKIPEKSCYVC